MAEPSTVARPYAEAAFRLASAANALAKWSGMIGALAQVAEDRRVQAAIADPARSDAQAAGVFISILAGRLDGQAENFVRVLAENKRLVLAIEQDAKVDILHACGGNARCTTCRVEFIAGDGPVALIFRVPVRKFVKAVKEPAVIAFSTTSSEAALPRAMEVIERLGVPRRIVAFVLPLGYSFNLDGTTLYLSLASVFVAQAAGVELTAGQQITMLLTLMLTSKGVAGVPRASLVILAGTLASYGLPQRVRHAHLAAGSALGEQLLQGLRP